MISIGGTVIAQAISSATRTLTAPVAGQSFSLPYLSGCHDQYRRDGDRSGNIQCYWNSLLPQLMVNHILSCIFQAAMISIGGTVIAQAISSATRTLTAPVVPEVANVALPSR